MEDIQSIVDTLRDALLRKLGDEVKLNDFATLDELKLYLS